MPEIFSDKLLMLSVTDITEDLFTEILNLKMCCLKKREDSLLKLLILELLEFEEHSKKTKQIQELCLTWHQKYSPGQRLRLDHRLMFGLLVECFMQWLLE
jgi:hypothetical protein